MGKTVTFTVAVAKAPENVGVDTFFARYISGRRQYVPKWLSSEGIVPMPTSSEEAGYEPFTVGAVRVGDTLVFEDVPEVGMLIPGVHSQQKDVALIVKEKVFTKNNPAQDKARYCLDFMPEVKLIVHVGHIIEGETCPECLGLGTVYKDGHAG